MNINELQSLHDCFCKVTGHDLKFQLQERKWYEFVKAGFGMEDLTCVLLYMLASNRKNDFKYSLKIHNVIGDLERFDSICGEARAIKRNQKRPATPREQVLNAWRPVMTETNGNGRAHHISELIKIPSA
jgi:hypothetical protein